jgi:uncharacterized membrane protein
LSVRVTSLGHALFAASLAGLGFLSLVSGDFALNWQPVPTWVIWRAPLARSSGLVMFAGGLGMLAKGTATISALVVGIYALLWLLLLRLPPVIADPTTELMWLGFAENLALLAGGWILLTTLARSEARPRMKRIAGDDSVPLARLLYGVALPFIGLSHFVYIQGTTALVPMWLPFRVGLAYLAGAGQIVAGVGLLLGVLPRASATLEALLLSSFTVLVWVPRVADTPASRFPWTALFVSAAITGAAWVVAESLEVLPWGSVGSGRRLNVS